MSPLQNSQHSASIRSSNAFSAQSISDLGGRGWKEEIEMSTFDMFQGISSMHAMLSNLICVSSTSRLFHSVFFVGSKRSAGRKTWQYLEISTSIKRAASFVGSASLVGSTLLVGSMNKT